MYNLTKGCVVLMPNISNLDIKNGSRTTFPTTSRQKQIKKCLVVMRRQMATKKLRSRFKQYNRKKK